jgi:hypothetical protein
MKLFDSTVLIAHLRGVARATTMLRKAAEAGEARCSVLSRVEIEGGMRAGEKRDVRRVFAGLTLEPVTDTIAARAGQFLRTHRRSHPGIDIIDYVIAATADVLGYELLTLNVKHFPMVRGLRSAF